MADRPRMRHNGCIYTSKLGVSLLAAVNNRHALAQDLAIKFSHSPSTRYLQCTTWKWSLVHAVFCTVPRNKWPKLRSCWDCCCNLQYIWTSLSSQEYCLDLYTDNEEILITDIVCTYPSASLKDTSTSSDTWPAALLALHFLFFDNFKEKGKSVESDPMNDGTFWKDTITKGSRIETRFEDITSHLFAVLTWKTLFLKLSLQP